ncbi:2,3-bisphosphoglycerate-independent phosphoglycerate mutase [Candidatus Finniella inopinata]|uniref:2,3-bisphosphoglycerate-independent phosphoglycerate mutase n=1 Tax=Candidatus Finniella inopinata TaxID=1696036 RepID=A0A4Q7DH71_9PROT|nr:2,3-bisphosphoglycerate-independent phosphoglycerate mutase [Candidatus Finniella inopinata]RZI46052.1 2,3-bisphosphoglycerate-independent phosphoglycerate mutase [Candidatus Finniella inopinata]
MSNSKTKGLVLCILDGWGVAEASETNAISLAATYWAQMLLKYPHTTLAASETKVGLPQGQMGNSEVGHMAIGLGRVMMQDLPRINQAIADGTLQTQEPLEDLIADLSQNKGVCHVMGLLSSGGVHSHQDHFFALLEILNQAKIPVKIHAFLDGRDTPPKSSTDSIKALQPFLNDQIQLATLSGRYYAMDRDQRWDRTTKAYQAIAHGQSDHHFKDAFEAIDFFYEQGIMDEFIPPCVIDPSYEGMEDGQGLLMVNFRADRVRQLLTMLVNPTFPDRSNFIKWTAAIGMAEYSDDLTPYLPPIFPRIPLHNSLGEVIARAGKAQLRIAETEKYAHVTFFFNGGREQPFDQEDRILIPSPDAATYDLHPEMSAAVVTENVVKAIQQGKHELVIVNYANPDMVGHTGNLEATKKAIQTIDGCLKQLEKEALINNWTVIVTADHGNAEQMTDDKGHIHTAHTCNPVPFLVMDQGEGTLRSGGALSDIAPTILEILGHPIPVEMTGQSLLVKP